MSKKWPTVRLDEVVRLDLDRVPIDVSMSYPMVGVLSFGRGLFDREPIENGNTSYKYFCRLKAEHIVMSQLFGWEGALALCTEKFSGKYLSPQFPTFLCEKTKLDRQFLGWLMRRPAFWEDLGSRASGMGDRRRTLNPEAFFACEIPLPPLAEQRRIVARIEELAAQINEARTLYFQREKEMEGMLISMAHRLDVDENRKRNEGWRFIQLGEILQLVANSYIVERNQNYPNLGIYSFGRGLFHKPPIDGALTSANALYRVSKGQFIYSRLFAFEGAYGIVTDDYDGFFVSNEYPTFNCDPLRIRAEFLAAFFRSSAVWKEVATGSKGIGDRRQRVHPNQILSYQLWLPPIEWQNPIVKVQAEINSLKHWQDETAHELDALLPSILDKAFKGEL